MINVYNLSPDRCHQFDTTLIKIKKYETHLYNCGCGEHIMKTRKHRKILNGVKYRCVKCSEFLKYKSYVGKT